MEWKFFTDHLAPGERLGETLFGLIMTLTFTIGAGFVVGTAEGASTALLYATISCNVAWGLIDGVLLVLGRMFDRGRLVRLGHAIAGVEGVYDRHAYDDEKALALKALAALMERIINPPADNVVALRSDGSQ